MSKVRKDLRADLRTAIAAVKASHAPLANAPVISAWAQSLDPKSLPAIGLATPGEDREPLAQDMTDVRVTAVIVVKRVEPNGDDGTALEAALDDDAQALIDGVEQTLIETWREIDCRSSAIDIAGAGSPRIGTLTLTFAASVYVTRNTL